MEISDRLKNLNFGAPAAERDINQGLYVIMPNHAHALIAFRNTQGQSINAIVGNGKRFMVYDLIKRLKEQNNAEILSQLESFVNPDEKIRGKLHEVFEPSFDWKECTNDKFIYQKLDYIHENPCRGTWKLAAQPDEYLHSSANFYSSGVQGLFEVKHIMEIEDVDLTKPLLEE